MLKKKSICNTNRCEVSIQTILTGRDKRLTKNSQSGDKQTLGTYFVISINLLLFQKFSNRISGPQRYLCINVSKATILRKILIYNSARSNDVLLVHHSWESRYLIMNIVVTVPEILKRNFEGKMWYQCTNASEFITFLNSKSLRSNHYDFYCHVANVKSYIALDNFFPFSSLLPKF